MFWISKAGHVFERALRGILKSFDIRKPTVRSHIFHGVLIPPDIAGMRSALAAGANPNARDHLGMTPLLSAVYRGDVQAVTILLEAGADPNLADAYDPMCTPLWHAEEDFGLYEVAGVLRAFGARL